MGGLHVVPASADMEIISRWFSAMFPATQKTAMCPCCATTVGQKVFSSSVSVNGTEKVAPPSVDVATWMMLDGCPPPVASVKPCQAAISVEPSYASEVLQFLKSGAGICDTTA